MSNQLTIAPTQAGKRRRFTFDQKRALVLAAEALGQPHRH
jgi:hypothetical protein